MTLKDAIRPYLSSPIIGEPYRRSLWMAQALLCLLALLCLTLGIVEAFEAAAHHFRSAQMCFVTGVILVLLVGPIAAAVILAARLRGEYRRLAERGEFEQLRLLPDLPQPLLPYVGIAVYEPLWMAFVLMPLVGSSTLCLGRGLPAFLSWPFAEGPYFLYYVLLAGFGIIISLVVRNCVLLLASPLGMVVMLKARDSFDPADCDVALDDEWERASLDRSLLRRLKGMGWRFPNGRDFLLSAAPVLASYYLGMMESANGAGMPLVTCVVSLLMAAVVSIVMRGEAAARPLIVGLWFAGIMHLMSIETHLTGYNPILLPAVLLIAFIVQRVLRERSRRKARSSVASA